MKTIKEFWKKFRLNHHYCENNAKLVDSYSGGDSINGNIVATHQVSIYKCKICGKRWGC